MQNPVVFGFETENYGVCVFFLEHGFVYAQTKLVSPFGRDVAQRQRGLAPSLRELACRLAARLREQPVICHASGKLLRRPVRVLLLPSRLAPCHLPQRGRLCLRTDQTYLSLWERCRAATERAGSLFEGAGLPPCGKTEGATSYLSRIRQTLAQTCPRAAPSVTACAVPPSSGRKALVFRAIQTRLSLWERCLAATERAGSLFEGAGLPPCGKTEGAAS